MGRLVHGRYNPLLQYVPHKRRIGSPQGCDHFVTRRAFSVLVAGSAWAPLTLRWWCSCAARFPLCGHSLCREVTYQMMQRRMQPAGDAQHVQALKESKLLGVFPNILLHCCCHQYDDGSPRTLGWVTLRVYRGLWELVVKEPDAALSLAVADPNLDDAFVLLETLLGDPTAPWQHDQYLQQRKPNTKSKKT
jgi:hypothetical protein